MAFLGDLGNFLYHDVYGTAARFDSRQVRAAADIGLKAGAGGYYKERLENAKHETDTNIASPNKMGWKALASYLAASSMGGGAGGGGAAAGEAGAGAGASADYYAAADTAGGLDATYGSDAAYANGIAGGGGEVAGGAVAGNADKAALYGNEGYGASGSTWQDYLQRLSNFGKGGWGQPALRTLGGLYSMSESQKLKRQSAMPSMSDYMNSPAYGAGLDAVRRQMAAGGYGNSGNMLAALQQQGQQGYLNYAGDRRAAAGAQAGGTYGTLSGLAMLASGLGGF